MRPRTILLAAACSLVLPLLAALPAASTGTLSGGVLYVTEPARLRFTVDGYGEIDIQVNSTFNITLVGCPDGCEPGDLFLLYPENHFTATMPTCAPRAGTVRSAVMGGGYDSNMFGSNAAGRYRLVLAGLTPGGDRPVRLEIGIGAGASVLVPQDFTLSNVTSRLSQVPVTSWGTPLNPLAQEFSTTLNLTAPRLVIAGFGVDPLAGVGEATFEHRLTNATAAVCDQDSAQGFYEDLVLFRSGLLPGVGLEPEYLPAGSYGWNGSYEGGVDVAQNRFANAILYAP